MANIKKDVTITTVTIPKKRYRFTGQNFDSETNTITINYDIIALNATNVELFKHAQGSVEIPQSRFGEAHIAAFLSAGQTMIETELPNS